jgi:uncharacterized protein (DUF58 family)
MKQAPLAPQNPIAARMHDKMRRIEICTRRLSTDSLHGGTKSRFRGRGMDFDEVREYEPGDDVRAIDWNATARTGRVFVKKYREERQLTIVFVVDMSASGALGAGDMTKQEQAIEIAGVLALSAQSRDDWIGMVLFTNTVELFVPPARGRQHTMRLIHELVTFQPKGRGTNLSLALRNVRERLTKRAIVVVLSDFLLDATDMKDSSRELRVLAHKHDVVTIRTADLNDRGFPSVGLVTLEDAETGEVVEVDTGSGTQRSLLEDAVRHSDERIRALARSAHVDMLELDTLQPYLGPLVGFFRSRGARS